MTFAPLSPACVAPAGHGTSRTGTAGCDGCWLIEGGLAHPLPPEGEYMYAVEVCQFFSVFMQYTD